MFSEESLEHFRKFARDKADKEIANRFHPSDRDSMDAKLMWLRIYEAEYEARIYDHRFNPKPIANQ